MKSLLIILICAFFAVSIAPLRAETGTSQGKDEVRAWWGEVGTGFRYESNIFQTKNNKESDLLQEFSIFLAYQPEKIKWSGRTRYDKYRKNKELSYSTFEVGAERPFGKRDYGSLFFNLSPTALLDKQDATVDTFALGSLQVSASFDRDTDYLGNIGIALSYARLDYEPPFDAKDTDVISLSPSLFYKINDFWIFYGEYTYEIGTAKTGTTPGGFRDDISYTAQGFFLQMTHHLSKKSDLRFRYRIRNKRFTTGGDDNFHANRKDTHHSLYGTYMYSVMKNLWMESRIDYLWKSSTDPFVEYNSNQFTFIVGYQF